MHKQAKKITMIIAMIGGLIVQNTEAKEIYNLTLKSIVGSQVDLPVDTYGAITTEYASFGKLIGVDITETGVSTFLDGEIIKTDSTNHNIVNHTISFWYKAEAAPTTDKTLFLVLTSGSDANGYELNLNQGQLEFKSNDGPTQLTTNFILTSAWTHIAIVVESAADKLTVTFLQNGVALNGSGADIPSAVAGGLDSLQFQSGNTFAGIYVDDTALDTAGVISTADSSLSLPNMLLLRYNFEETSGTDIKDDVMHNDMTKGTSTVDKSVNSGTGETGHKGKNGNGFRLNGVNISLPVTQFNRLDTAITLSFWYKGDSLNNGGSVRLIRGMNKFGDNGREINLWFPYRPNGPDYIYLRLGVEGKKAHTQIEKNNDGKEIDGTWHHWLMTKDSVSGRMEIFVDNVSWKVGLTGHTKRFGTFFDKVELGLTSFDGGMKGVIDDLRVYNYVLDATERTAVFDDTTTPAIGLELVQEGRNLTWTLDAEVGVIKYQIVVNGEVVATVMADGSTSYTHTLDSDDKAELVVVDNHGSQTYLPIDGNLVTTPYELKKGWNMIAITSDQANITPLLNAAIGPLWAWNGSNYERTLAPEATDAIWINSASTTRVDVTGEKSDVAIALSSGWNLVGPTNNQKVPAEAMSVFSYNDTYSAITEEDHTLIRGVGYWIFSL